MNRSYPYERHCKMLQKSGLIYMVCPGTIAWTSISGRTDNMLATIEVATKNAVKYGARGMLLTDWGDMGHWRYFPLVYAGYAAGAAMSWNSKSAENLLLNTFLNSYVFRDENSIMGDLIFDSLGRYNRYEEIPILNMTTTLLSLQFGLRDKLLIAAIFDKVIKGINDLMKDLAEMMSVFKEKFDNRHPFDYQGLQKFIDSKEALLARVKIKTADGLTFGMN